MWLITEQRQLIDLKSYDFFWISSEYDEKIECTLDIIYARNFDCEIDCIAKFIHPKDADDYIVKIKEILHYDDDDDCCL